MLKQELIDTLEEIIEAGQEAISPLDMAQWIEEDLNTDCGYSCCLIGDLAIKRSDHLSVNGIKFESTDLSEELDNLCACVLGNYWISHSIYCGKSEERLDGAEYSNLLTKEELKHPHLTTDHNDRTIAHDYIRLVIRKVKDA